MKLLILFDIDGTILQMKKGISRDIFSKFLVNLFGKEIHNAHIPTFHGMTDMQIIKEIAENINYPFAEIEPKLTEIWSDLSSEFERRCTRENIDLMPGAIELIKLLASDTNIKLGLLTGNIKRNAYAKLNVYGLGDFFPIGAFGDDCYDRNKLPEIAFKRADEFYENVKFDSRNSILIGDSPRDIECGKTNGIAVVGVATGWSSRQELMEDNPDFLFDDFNDTEKVYKTIINHFAEK